MDRVQVYDTGWAAETGERRRAVEARARWAAEAGERRKVAEMPCLLGSRGWGEENSSGGGCSRTAEAGVVRQSRTKAGADRGEWHTICIKQGRKQ